ncbi:hypothetical protein LTR86_004219 [Recurvomyces mirabilis]|nr:hypothetical protein LTR86_004219 [Recurvomyces mirabilis]
MQTETHHPRKDMSFCHPLTVLQAERVRAAANNSIRRETRQRDVRLPRLVGHVAILEALDVSSPPPGQREAVLDTLSTPHSNVCLESKRLAPDSDVIPDLQEDTEIEDDSDDDEWSADDDASADDEDYAEHRLMNVDSHLSTCIEEIQHTKLTTKRSSALGPFGVAEVVPERKENVWNELQVTESVEEVTIVEDR